MTAKPKAVTTIDAGTINAREFVFSSTPTGSDDRRYILQAADSADEYLTLLTRFPKHQIKRTTDHYIDDTEGKWFACYNVDCFDPPMAIVRARSQETAYESFCDEFGAWLAVSDTDAKDYPENEREYNGSGQHIDASNVQICEIFLLEVRV